MAEKLLVNVGEGGIELGGVSGPVTLAISGIGKTEIEVPASGVKLGELPQYRVELRFNVNGETADYDTVVEPGDVVVASAKHSNG